MNMKKFEEKSDSIDIRAVYLPITLLCKQFEHLLNSFEIICLLTADLLSRIAFQLEPSWVTVAIVECINYLVLDMVIVLNSNPKHPNPHKRMQALPITH